MVGGYRSLIFTYDIICVGFSKKDISPLFPKGLAHWKLIKNPEYFGPHGPEEIYHIDASILEEHAEFHAEFCLSASDIKPMMGNYLFLFWPNLTYGYEEWSVNIEKREAEKTTLTQRILKTL